MDNVTVKVGADGSVLTPRAQPTTDEQILMHLRLIAELLATMHPFKPEITFERNEYFIRWGTAPDDLHRQDTIEFEEKPADRQEAQS